MTRSQLFLLAFSAFLMLAGPISAAPKTVAPEFDPEVVKALAGRNVLLLVGPASATKAQKAHYLDLLKRSGADLKRYPVYSVESLSPEAAGKLGLAKRAPGYGALVRWGNPARFGPARVLAPGVVTDLTSDADLFVLIEDAVLASGQGALLAKLPPDLQTLRPKAQLTIDQVDFQANGKPLYVVDTKVRIKNSGKVAAKGVIVIFQVENPNDGSWYELGRHANLEVKAGETMTRDLVRTTHDTPLLNAKNEIQPTKYRIRVESATGSLESTDEFKPLLFEDQK